MDTYNLTYDELQKKDCTNKKEAFSVWPPSIAFVRERLIMTDTKINLGAIIGDNLAFTGASNSNLEYLMAENKKSVKNL